MDNNTIITIVAIIAIAAICITALIMDMFIDLILVGLLVYIVYKLLT